MIIDVAPPVGSDEKDRIIFAVKKTYFVDDDLHAEHVAGMKTIVSSHNGEKPTIALSYDNEEVFEDENQ
jgi:hypothetical protein